MKRPRTLEETLKDLTKEVQGLVKEKEAVEKRRTEAIKKHTELELDVNDLQERISGNNRAKGDATRQLEILQKEIQDSMDELDKIHPFYEKQVIKEKEITKGYVYGS
uniref:Uncharacterized protein n=1 Tax=Fagus sylvatica TaxID=28930 RepID=A0A2N9FHJ9_FAGSY